jgi:hypothetical protein
MLAIIFGGLRNLQELKAGIPLAPVTLQGFYYYE